MAVGTTVPCLAGRRCGVKFFARKLWLANLRIEILNSSVRILTQILQMSDFTLEGDYAAPQLLNQLFICIESSCVHVHVIRGGVVVHVVGRSRSMTV